MIGTDRLVWDGPVVSGDLGALRKALDNLGYRSEAIRSMLNINEELPARDTDLVVHQRRLSRSPGALADVIAIFTLGFPVPVERLTTALGAGAVDELVESGALRIEDDQAIATVRLVAHGELWIAADARPQNHAAADPLHVTGINAPAGLLAALTVRGEVDTMLDLGTGNGIQALLAARHARHVVATDINPRAIGFARFNAALNGISGIDFRIGSLFEPVAGERFDRIVTNPPYVISPDNDYVYRDSGSAPAAMCRTIAGEIPAHLTPGGYATLLASWPTARESDWSEMPVSWLSPDVDAWLLHYRTEDPLTHAAKWNQPAAEVGADAYAAAIDRWTEFDDEAGIDEIAFGALILRGRDDHDGQVIGRDRLRVGPGSASAQIQRVFAAHDATRTGADIRTLRLRPAPGHRLDQRMQFLDGAWQLTSATFSTSEGIDLPISVDAVLVQAIAALDGTRTVDDAATAAAAACGLGSDDVEALADLVAHLVKELYRLGMLEAVEC